MKTHFLIQIAVLLFFFGVSNASVNTKNKSLYYKKQTVNNLTDKPDLRDGNVCKNIILKKSLSEGYWLYHKPTNYYLKIEEDYFSITSGPKFNILYYRK